MKRYIKLSFEEVAWIQGVLAKFLGDREARDANRLLSSKVQNNGIVKALILMLWKIVS